MEIFVLVLLALSLVVLIFVVAYKLIPETNVIKMKFKLKQKLIGTWITEDGEIKLVINHSYLTYSDDYNGMKERHFYRTEDFKFKEGKFVVKPVKFDKRHVFGLFEKIKYSNDTLVGRILVSDVGVSEWELRKDW